MARKSRRTRRLRVVNPDCAGIDIGKDRHFVAVDPERSDEPVRSFGAFTRDLEEMAAWLASCGVTKVAMESTSVYWIPVYECCSACNFDPQYQATSIAYRADRRATHAPNNTQEGIDHALIVAQRLGRAAREQAAVGQAVNVLGQAHDHAHVVLDDEERDAELPVGALQALDHAVDQRRIDARRRLVEQQHARAHHQRHRKLQQLALADGKLTCHQVALAPGYQANPGDRRQAPATRLSRRRSSAHAGEASDRAYS